LCLFVFDTALCALRSRGVDSARVATKYNFLPSYELSVETRHRLRARDATDLDLDADSVQLVVTSPPYPMVELWDDLFTRRRPEIGKRLSANDGVGAFEAMHEDLDEVWSEVARVLAPGGMACINVGDATRRVGDQFRLFHNAARIAAAFERLGLVPLPRIVWRKPANSAAKFMGSGMLPPNAYVTQEHEFVLLFRNGGPRSFRSGADRRYRAAFFWEERNRWFSDLWTDIGGDDQHLEAGPRDRSAAFPLALPYRLITMFSVYGDTILDPFWGTGTTTLAAMAAARNSVGYELVEDLVAGFQDRADDAAQIAERLATDRLQAHRAFVRQRRRDDNDLSYDAEHYDFPVVTRQERRIRLRGIEDVQRCPEGYRVEHDWI
jgi:DNA modification methylase